MRIVQTNTHDTRDLISFFSLKMNNKYNNAMQIKILNIYSHLRRNKFNVLSVKLFLIIIIS